MLHGYNNRCHPEDAFGIDANEEDNMDEDEDLDLTSCFVCDRKHENIESCMHDCNNI